MLSIKKKINRKKIFLLNFLLPVSSLILVACQSQVTNQPIIVQTDEPTLPIIEDQNKEPEKIPTPPIVDNQDKKPLKQPENQSPKNNPQPTPLNPAPPVEKEPNQPAPNPQTPQVVAYSINKEELKNLIQNNQYGYSPKSLVLAFKDKQKANNDTRWLKSLVKANESNIEWNDITNLVFEADDQNGTLSGSFSIGKQQLSFNLNSEDGLLKTTDYYDHIKKLTMSIDVAYESIALGATGTNPQKTLKATENPNGLLLRDNKYINFERFSGTGWIMDRIITPNDATNDTLSYVVGTNIHVGSFADAFITNIDGIDVPLDPVNIQYAWKRNVIGKKHEGFDDTAANDTMKNEISNLRFGEYNLLNNKGSASPKLIGLNAYSAIPSFFQPNSKMVEQKKKLLNSLIFVPNHKTTTIVNGNTITYNALGADFMAIRMDLKKTDLQQHWPELWQAYQSKTENQLFLPINKIKNYDKEDLYVGGYPGYRYHPDTPSWEKWIYQQEGYDYATQQQTDYWKAATLSKFVDPSLEHPAIYHEESLEPKAFNKLTTDSDVSGLPKIKDQKDGQNNDPYLRYIDFYDAIEFNKIWGKKVPIEEIFEGNALTPEQIQQLPAKRISDREIDPNWKIMYKKIHGTAKKITMESSKFLKSGISGTMVINAKKEIVGIVSNVVSNYVEDKNLKNAVFFDFNNTYDKMQGNKNYGLDIANKFKSQNINTVLINPKN